MKKILMCCLLFSFIFSFAFGAPVTGTPDTKATVKAAEANKARADMSPTAPNRNLSASTIVPQKTVVKTADNPKVFGEDKKKVEADNKEKRSYRMFAFGTRVALFSSFDQNETARGIEISTSNNMRMELFYQIYLKEKVSVELATPFGSIEQRMLFYGSSLGTRRISTPIVMLMRLNPLPLLPSWYIAAGGIKTSTKGDFSMGGFHFSERTPGWEPCLQTGIWFSSKKKSRWLSVDWRMTQAKFVTVISDLGEPTSTYKGCLLIGAGLGLF
jgi:hypothetical protein